MSSKIKAVSIIVVLLGVLGVLVFFLVKPVDSGAQENTEPTQVTQTVAKATITNKVTAPGEITPAVTEKLKFDKWKYFGSFVAPLDCVIPAGTPLVEYAGGGTLIAPYDLVVRSKNLPEKKWEELTEEHFVEASRVDLLRVDVDVPEQDIASLAVGQNAQVVLGSNKDKVFMGTIVKINPIGTYDATGSKYRVSIEISNDGSVMVGMSANVSIVVGEASDVLTVPVSAVSDSPEGTFVTVVRSDGATEPIFVQTGLSDGMLVEVAGDIEEGDRVVVNELSPRTSQKNSGPSLSSSSAA